MKKILRTIATLAVLACFFEFISSTVISQDILLSNNSLEETEMLIFLSPQYSTDRDIEIALQKYVTIIQDELEWNVHLIKLSSTDNDYKKIDTIIERYFASSTVKACLMIGEDIDTALAGSSGYMRKPSTVPWYTTGGSAAYELSETNTIINKPYRMDICISLLYPTHTLSYKEKKSQLLSVIEKFCDDRRTDADGVLALESAALNQNSKALYGSISTYKPLFYQENPTDTDVNILLKQSYAMVCVHGHSNPAGTMLNEDEDVWFSADDVETLNTPLFVADGCYVGGWWTNVVNAHQLNPSIDCPWYGSQIFTSSNVRAMVLGLLSQTGHTSQVSFFENTVSSLLTGKTLAESLIGHTYIGDSITIYGDPTLLL